MLRLLLSWSLLSCAGPSRQAPLGAAAGAVPSAAQTLVWGPGLEADVVLPARFFFIQAADSSGRNFTTSPGEKTFEVSIVCPVEQFTRIWVQVLDRRDGSFLVRYRMYATYTDLQIHVLLRSIDVAKSPFILKGPVYHEGCDCPQPSGSAWQESMHCPASFPQIESDLALYPRVDPERYALEIPQRFGQRQSLCHYTIKDNKAVLAWQESMHCPASFPQIESDLALYPRVDPERYALEIPQRFGQRQSLCHYTIKDNKIESDLALYPRVDPERYALEIPQRFGQRQSLCHYTIKDNKIESDLALYPRVDPERYALEIPQRFGQRQSLCHYTIKDNKVYIKTLGEHVGFRIFMDALLLSLTRKVGLPDMEFFVNLGDWPLEKRRPSERLHPIFSWCGSNDTRDIVMPTYDLTESVLETMGRVSLDMMSVQANTGPTWGEKNATAFWRGRDSRKERLELVKLARAQPDMVDAAFTNFFFFKHDEDLYGPLVKHVSFFDFFKYKYQINIDGTVAAYRLPYLLASDSVVLKQDSGYYEHFYSQLKPWEHYIPIRADLADLMDKIRWAREHDEEARNIAVAGQQFARNHLMGDSIFCYYYTLFQEYAKLQVTEPQIREGMELVEQPADDLFPCFCHRTRAKDEL